MNEEIMRSVGFEKKVELVKDKKCPFCIKPIIMSEFKDELSVKEYSISGLCQKCQDDFFK